MPLVYLPGPELLFTWGSAAETARTLGILDPAAAREAELVTPDGRSVVVGSAVPALDGATKLALVPAAELETLPRSTAIWALASRFGLELVARERVVPTLARRNGKLEARWAAALSGSEDSAKAAALARSMPPAAHAVPVADGAGLEVWAKEALLRAFLDGLIDAFVRAARGGPSLPPARPPKRGGPSPSAWHERFRDALATPDRAFEPSGFSERSVIEDVARWSEPAMGARDRLRACFRLEPPNADREPFTLRFLLQSPDDPSLLIEAADVWKTRGRSLEKLGRAFRDPQESLLEALGRAARLFPPLERALAGATPEALELDPEGAFHFLGEGAAALGDAGFGVLVPAELTASGQRRLRLRMRVGAKSKVAGAVGGASGLGLDELLTVDWEAIVGEIALSGSELRELARRKTPLVRFRGAWVAVDPAELAEIQERMARGPGRMTVREAVQAALAGEARAGTLTASVAATGAFASMLETLRSAASAAAPSVPAALRASLRPYQERGLGWLSTLARLGLGACLADDMGLGKTVQLLAFLLHRRELAPADPRPSLLVAPTSVIGNWEREVARFAPDLMVAPHYGSERQRSAEELTAAPAALVITSYGVLRRDAELLSAVDWASVVLDEAQNIKNSASATAQAARRLRSSHRFALTGTPVENRLAELWSILEFANPGLLGPLEIFRREFAVPIERYGNDERAQRLQRLVSPFVLRRLKSDPAILSDLPPKNEMNVICTLTREQASLYKAVVDEEMRRIEKSEGIERRGRVLALLTFLKQICNHPAQYLSEAGPLGGRSGKLARVTEMLEEALAAGDRALVFTQYREMGERLAAHLAEELRSEVLFLHGGTGKKQRDEMVQRFQQEARGPQVFVLSVKAGGTGLNLTAASHVFHYDRWWNPAVEDQATDRAYRIGQTRSVQVHKLVCAGTVEEKVDRLIAQKRALSQKVLAAGERWITELANAELHDLFALSKEAVVDADDADGEATPARTRRKRTRAPEARA
jgi:hypothetical protein